MIPLPVIVSLGGISPAGRSSSHRGYSRLVADALPGHERAQLLASLAGLRQSTEAVNARRGEDEDCLLQGSLIRSLNGSQFDPRDLPYLRPATLQGGAQELRFTLDRRQLPSLLPAGWRVLGEHDSSVEIGCASAEVLLKHPLTSKISSAGQLPDGFDPAALYASRSHPRALQMTVFGTSDAVNSMGIDWETIRAAVAPDAISVYAGNCMGQLDQAGFGGMLQARLLGRPVSSKQLPLGLTEMPADFINAYLLGNLGTTGTSVAACATFLYNLRQGILDIQAGRSRVAIIGASEAPLTPEVFEGFGVMGALGDDAGLRALDGLAADAPIDSRRACRPFGENCGFTLAESAQFTILMDDALALELGANILGAVSDVFINADGYKKSIAGPGLGNYLTVARAAAAARSILGVESLRERSLVQAHGTGTPQNRVSESAILDRVAAEFGIRGWRVGAVKAFLGHSLASSAGDQLMATLGCWRHDIIPGIETVSTIAEDVSRKHLDFVLKHRAVESESIDVALLNSKGFGGNNATATILAPHIVRAMMRQRFGAKALREHAVRNEAVAAAGEDYDAAASRGEHRILYRFDQGVLGEEALAFTQARDEDGRGRGPTAVAVGAGRPSVDLDAPSPYADTLGGER